MNPPSWLSEILANPQITDICINGDQETFVDCGHGMEKISHVRWDETQLQTWVIHQLSQIGKSWDAKNPFIDATLQSGHRIHIAFPPICPKGLLISLRKLPSASCSLRWQTDPYFETLCQIVKRGESLMVAGATGSGKTTLINDLLQQIPSHERVIALEDTLELNPSHPHFISLLSRPPNADGYGEITLRTLLKQALRMRPDRILLGECRGSEVLDLLLALNTGHRGAMATLHANSCRDALKRLELLCLVSSSTPIPLSVLRDLIASGIRWVAFVQRQKNARFIGELLRVEGKEGEIILLRPWRLGEPETPLP